MPLLRTHLDEMFKYHSPDGDDQQKYDKINEAALDLARAIFDACPPGSRMERAIETVCDARMQANRAVALKHI